ncbi:MAG: GNAT family N-acetyltransferase [Methylovirgula sp.]
MIPITPAMARLVTPSVEFVAAYVEAQRDEAQANLGPRLPETAVAAMTRLLEGYVMKAAQRQTNNSNAYQQLWLIAGRHYVGRVSLRPDIGAPAEATAGHIAYEIRPAFRRRGFGHRALALGIDELRRQGVGALLLLCEADNSASIKIVEAAGGALENVAPHRNFPDRLIRRYWIRERSQ